MIVMKCPKCGKRLRMLAKRKQPTAGPDGVVRGYRWYECPDDRTRVTVELAEAGVSQRQGNNRPTRKAA